MNLHGLRVLITRPRGRGELLAGAIREAGGSVTEVPLLAVEPLDPQRDADTIARTSAQLRGLDRYDAVIAISINAVEFGLRWATEYRSQWPANLRWYGIGAATTEALEQWGAPVEPAAAGMNTEALLTLPSLQHIAGQRLLILRGIGGRETLAQQLRERGAQVEYAECYRRSEPQLAATERARLTEPVDAICVNSAETLANLWNNLPAEAQPRVCAQALIVPSQRVAERAAILGFTQVIVATNAGTPATLAALAMLAADMKRED
jgi:uroporphyrinogen-III synthase